MDSKPELIANLMAELTGRYEDLSMLTISQHRSDVLEMKTLEAIVCQSEQALRIAQTAWLLFQHAPTNRSH